MSDSGSTTKPDETAAKANAQTQQNCETKKRPLRKRLLRLMLFLIYLVVLLEVGSRIYWKIKRDVPFFAGRQGWYGRFYEELKDSGVWEADLGKDNDTFDVLLLGGSALDRIHRSLGIDSSAMPEAFGKFAGRKANVYNLAAPGMSTLDSLIKYRLMAKYDKHFDLVVVYHGINDVRLNNCPSEKFRDDYTHAGFYKQIKRMEAQMGLLPFFRLPYTIEYTIIHIMSSKKFEFYVPRHKLNPSWKQHGTQIKTATPFRENLLEIIRLADATRSEPIVLLTFAWYIPEDYSLAKCQARQLDYSGQTRPDAVENWGTVEGVRKGLAVHNRVIRQLKGQPGAVVLDFESMVPKNGENFNDVCHLSEEGKQLFLDALIEKLVDSRMFPG